MEQKEPKHYLLAAAFAKKMDPRRYIIPPPDALRMLHAGHLIKLLAAVPGKSVEKTGEEIWTVITHRDRDTFVGMVYDTLSRSNLHGLKKGVPIQFKKAHIIDICFKADDKDTGVKREYKLL